MCSLVNRPIASWRIALGLTACLLVAASAAVRAEVTAEVDPTGRYVRTLIISRMTVERVSIWAAVPRSGYVPLNPYGDLSQDLWPVLLEDPAAGNWPWVVWSRFNGADYDLAWSRWTDRGWQDVRWLQDAHLMGNDVDPDLTLDQKSRPYVAWWSDQAGVGQVYFSVFLETRWMDAYRVSDPGVDSRYPTITAQPDGSITVDFDTPGGVQRRTLLLNEGVSINDDADPVGTFTMKGSLGR